MQGKMKKAGRGNLSQMVAWLHYNDAYSALREMVHLEKVLWRIDAYPEDYMYYLGGYEKHIYRSAIENRHRLAEVRFEHFAGDSKEHMKESYFGQFVKVNCLGHAQWDNAVIEDGFMKIHEGRGDQIIAFDDIPF